MVPNTLAHWVTAINDAMALGQFPQGTTDFLVSVRDQIIEKNRISPRQAHFIELRIKQRLPKFWLEWGEDDPLDIGELIVEHENHGMPPGVIYPNKKRARKHKTRTRKPIDPMDAMVEE